MRVGFRRKVWAGEGNVGVFSVWGGLWGLRTRCSLWSEDKAWSMPQYRGRDRMEVSGGGQGAARQVEGNEQVCDH